MNAKRQTVWLVSMLSLMVVLSAYYLFTEDVNEVDVANSQLQGSEIKVDAVTTNGTTGTTDATKSGATGTQSTATGAQTTGTGTKTGTTGTTGTANANKGKTDAEVLKQKSTTATSGSDYFKTAQMKRNEEWGILTEKLLAESVDAKKSTADVEKALNELNKLQDQEARIANLEDLLGNDFNNALVLQDGAKWKVVVQAAKLEKSQGVTIIDLVMKELNVGPDKITIQYVQ
ncbi:SpoIIIAH-like family protein [Paenibacillus koleovorans]|uniref:SpoIIIAH-like family protein n=1 Tax=Paenibacillus koleovorans TaxID=121608 RepID=UPI000FDAD323|nr:SpoIIIAH-like family protein [Paenibacillus koleovorans]